MALLLFGILLSFQWIEPKKRAQVILKLNFSLCLEQQISLSGIPLGDRVAGQRENVELESRLVGQSGCLGGSSSSPSQDKSLSLWVQNTEALPCSGVLNIIGIYLACLYFSRGRTLTFVFRKEAIFLAQVSVLTEHSTRMLVGPRICWLWSQWLTALVPQCSPRCWKWVDSLQAGPISYPCPAREYRALSPPSLGLRVQEGEDCRRNPGLGAPRSLVSQPLESDISSLSLARDNTNIPQWQLSAGH